MVSQFFIAIGNYPKAVSFLSKHGLWGFMAVPAFINLLTLCLVGWAAWEYTGDLSLLIYERLSPSGVDASVSGWIKFATVLIVRLLAFFVYLKIYKYILLIVLSPFLSILAGKTLDVLHGTSAPFSFKRFASELLRGIAVTVQSFAMEMAFLVALLVLSFIPVLSPFTAVAFLVVEWFFLGSSMLDYYNEYEGRSARQSWGFCWKHKGATFGTGLGMYLFMLIPFGIFIAPMLAVVAGCLTGFAVGKKTV